MTDEIDERRALIISKGDAACGNIPRITALLCIGDRCASCACRDTARAIRASDEAAGYILIKHEGIISSEGMKPKGGE
jgi:hypothetical protein